MSDPAAASQSTSHRPELLQRARQGDDAALGELLDEHRAYLKVLSQRVLDRRLALRADESDMVQQTLLLAFRNFPDFRGEHPEQFAAWLREIHERQLGNLVRDHVGAQKRSLKREQSIEAAGDVTASQTTASQRLFRGERAVALAAALERLPPDQREAVRLRFIEGLPLEELCAQATAGLVKRGLINLRQWLPRDQFHA
jgi:RNA polymerase sigma-70 factor (ECF subfamily)